MLGMEQLQHGRIHFATAAEEFFRQPIRTKIHTHLRQSAEGLLKLKEALASGVSERKGLMERFDSLRREVDSVGQIRRADTLTEKAMGVLTSSKLVEALDLNRESEKTRARYGTGKSFQYQYDGSPTVTNIYYWLGGLSKPVFAS